MSVQKIEDHDQKQIFILNFTVVYEFSAGFASNWAAAFVSSSRSIDAPRLRFPAIEGVAGASVMGGVLSDVEKGGKPAGIPPGNGLGVDGIVTLPPLYIVRLYEDKQKG